MRLEVLGLGRCAYSLGKLGEQVKSGWNEAIPPGPPSYYKVTKFGRRTDPEYEPAGMRMAVIFNPKRL
jgi:hypothetical protein